jgi:hypothetical protein
VPGERTRHQNGFKGHVSFEPETGLFILVALTSGAGAGNHEPQSHPACSSARMAS